MHTNAQDTVLQKKFIDVSVSLSGFGGDYVTNSMGVQAGVEFRLKKNVAMQCDLRYIFDLPGLRGSGYFIINVDNLVGFAINTEVKVYQRQFRNELRGGYLGGQAFFEYTNASLHETQVNRNKIGIYGIVGWKYIGNKGFLFETSGGIGMQLISSYSTNKTYYISNEFPWSKSYDSGTNLYPDLTWNVRIGWRF